jgi:hypothetical protein
MKAAATAALILLLPVVSAAGPATDRMNIAAPVSAHITLSTLHEPETLSLSERDIERGYIEARARYDVKTNVPGGYRLRFVPRVGLASQITIIGLGGAVVLRDLEGDVFRPVSSDEVDLQLRIDLRPGLEAGRHPWPVLVAAEVD